MNTEETKTTQSINIFYIKKYNQQNLTKATCIVWSGSGSTVTYAGSSWYRNPDGPVRPWVKKSHRETALARFECRPVAISLDRNFDEFSDYEIESLIKKNISAHGLRGPRG